MTRLYYLCLLLGLLSSCRTEEVQQDPVHLKISSALISRAAKTEFKDGDRLGLYCLDEQERRYNDCPCSINNPATYQGGEWQLKHPVELSEESCYIYAYYPYSSSANDSRILPVESQSQTDYLYSVALSANRTAPSPRLQMRHALSLIRIQLLRGDYVGAGRVGEVYLHGIYREGNLDLRSGRIDPIGTRSDEVHSFQTQLGEEQAIDLPILVIPQSCEGVDIRFTIDGSNYVYSPPARSWEAGKEILYVLRVDPNSTLHLLATESIEGWTSGGIIRTNLKPQKN